MEISFNFWKKVFVLVIFSIFSCNSADQPPDNPMVNISFSVKSITPEFSADQPPDNPMVNISFSVKSITPEFVENIFGSAEWIKQWKDSGQERLVIVGTSASHTYTDPEVKKFADEVTSYCSNFINDIENAFRNIAKTEVGRQWLKDILSVDVETPVVIMQSDIYLLLALSNYIIEKPKNLELKEYIDFIKSSIYKGLLEIDKKCFEFVNFVVSGNGSRHYLELKEPESCNMEQKLVQNVATGPHVEISSHPGQPFKHNMVLLGGHDRLLISTITIGSRFQPELKLKFGCPDINKDFDVFVFHELNHYRHFLQKRRTFTSNGVHMYKGNSKNSFGLKLIRKKIRGSASLQTEYVNMFSNEEELQLTGFTRLPDQTFEVDPINETCYRIQRQISGGEIVLRYPYITPQLVLEESPVKNDYEWYIDIHSLNAALSEVLIDIGNIINFYKGLISA